VTVLTGPEERFQEFLSTFQKEKGEYKYRRRLGQLSGSGQRYVAVDFEDLMAYDSDLAKLLVDKPDEYLPYIERSAWAQLKIEDPSYAELVKKVKVRFRRLPERFSLRRVGEEHLGKLLLLDGIIVRATPVKPLITRAAFQCRKCNSITYVEQAGLLMRGPGLCGRCRSKIFDFVEKQSTFINSQELRMQERPEDLPPGQLPRALDVKLSEDLVDVARPGDRVALTGIVRAQQEVLGRRTRLRTFDLFLEANYIDVTGKEVEVVEITPEEEKQILEMANDPWIHRKLLSSLAPSIYGYGDIKEAILYLLFGAVPKTLPDGVTIRGDVNVLLIGDPGCLAADERIVLGNGAIVKIGELGAEHLQDIQVQVLSGQGGAKRDVATRFHIYPKQPILEVVTESGKSVKGTYNHPLLVVTKEKGAPRRRWKRLDEVELGDRVAVVTGFPCTIRAWLDTGFAPQQRTYEPKFRGRVPAKLTPKLAALLGYMTGDGWIQRYRIGFHVADTERDILPTLRRLVSELFGLEAGVVKRRRAHRKVLLHEVTVRSEDVASNFSFLRKKRIPSLVLRSGNKVASSYLRWLFEADGSVFDKGRGSRAITLKAKDVELLRDTQILLLRFGIHSRIIENNLLIRRGEDIIKFAKSVGFASKKKRTILAKLAASAKGFQRVHSQRSERVVRILRHPPQDVYDIEVPRSHRFIANGIISHNTAKSQLLQYVARVAPRGLYTSGRGSTAAGLTAAVVREKSGGLVLEAGALVLADKGVCSIDEIDKMRPDDRVAIHEAMEQQTVSVAKGGIVATLNARASVLAAANPALGRYDPYRNITENINLPVTILSRFDLIFVMRDAPDSETDGKMSEHILALHRTRTTPEEVPLTPGMFRKYVSYAHRIEPVLTEEAARELKDFYLRMRSTSTTAESPIAITPRQLEALVRLSECRARSFLRDKVTVEDTDAVIRLMTIALQDVGIDTTTGKMDIDVIMTGKPKSLRDRMQSILGTVAILERETGTVQESKLYEELLKKAELTEAEARTLVNQLIRDGILYSPRPGHLKRTAA
jgi:DNA replicative helicase MCM subunit Mcm2 (Cdc46/Mcm family)